MRAGRTISAAVAAATFVATMGSLLPAAGAPPTTTTHLVLSVFNEDGTPAVAVDVGVFYIPFNASTRMGSTDQLPLMASGITSEVGVFEADLDTSAVQVGALASNGSGQSDLFNAVALATTTDGQMVSMQNVPIEYGGVTSPSGLVLVRDDRRTTSRPRLARSTVAAAICDPSLSPCREVVGSKYRYVRVLALNKAAGMDASFVYNYTTSTKRETKVGVAYSDDNSSFTMNGTLVEEVDRASKTTFTPGTTGEYHKYVWANYYWVKYRYTYCPLPPICRTWWEWHANKWNGALTQDNPDIGPSGSRIGVLQYDSPPYDSDPNHHIVLSTTVPSHTEYQGQLYSYGFSLDVRAGVYVALTDKATYGTITKVTWAKTSGCSGSRVLWGSGTTVPDAPIVQASCV